MIKLSSIVVALLVVVTIGCASTVDPGEEGTGTYSWQQRELKGAFAGSLLDVADAAERAFNDLRLISVDQVVDGLKGTVTASTADGSRVRIKLKAMDFESTKFSIKVGSFGDKAMSQQVARYIARELAKGE
ncbi:MAG: DUF3568 family protein [Thermoanaerobaculales bacterium]|jgi:hypothetical protein|nr:DUF3568 family protein [Thermoanaerobaculales bacterium]